MNVLVYSGSDTPQTSFAHTLTSLRTLLAPNYAVQTVQSPSLASQPWSTSCALLVLPSLGPESALSASAAKEIQNYLSSGGRLLALGNRVRVGVRRAMSLSAQIGGLSISGSGFDSSPSRATTAAKLTLEDANTGLSFSLADTPSVDDGESMVDVQLQDGTRVEGLSCAGAVDLSDVHDARAKGIETLAYLLNAKGEKQLIAGAKATIGRGVAIFWGVHLESGQKLETGDLARLRVLRETLEELDLRMPLQDGASHMLARPTPQVLSSAPWRVGVVDGITRALGVSDLVKPHEFKDSNDAFVLHSHAQAEEVFREQRESAAKLSDDPAMTTNPKHIVIFKDAELPPKDLTPRFDIATYYEELAKARKERGCPESFPEGAWGVGEALLYGEVVTSTQTMLDKNTRLLTTLPTPFLSLASSQLTGRGRGGNIWLSPPGCLMFSLLLRVPLSALSATKIVFVQYLFALAVAEACREERVLGEETGGRVRIKWPNDIYATAENGERRKVGGILVNTSFGAGRVELVIGCGLNVLTPPPVPSLAQLLPTTSPRAPPTMERTLAAIMARFERMWADFVHRRGSFAPFMDLYLDRWLHSDQLVTLTTVTPPRKVRIVGITPDHGLLRTMPEQDAWAGAHGAGVEYVDLQPDGNSFDLMAGLIKTKT